CKENAPGFRARFPFRTSSGAPVSAECCAQGSLGVEQRMLQFLLRRIAVLIPTFIGVSLIAFAFIRLLPGDPVLLLAGQHAMTPEQHAAAMHSLGFDRPLPIQYLDYLGNVLKGDFGDSVVTKRPVLQ